MDDIVPAKHFIGTLSVNIDNDKLTDKQFRQFVRNSIIIVEGSQYIPKEKQNMSL